MKNSDFQRGIISRNSRPLPEGPNIGRVAKLRDADSSSDASRRRRGGRGNSARSRALLIWSAVLSVLTLIVIGLAVSFWLLPYLFRDPVGDAGLLVNRDAQVRVVSKFPSPSREQALEMVKRAITNRDPEKLESLFRMGSAGRAEILAFLNTSDKRDGFIDRYEWLSSMDVDGLLLDGVLVVYKNKERPVERLAFLTPDAAGNWKLDFDAFARTVKPSWQAVMDKGTEHALVRAFVGQDVYYNGPFGDDKQWVAYGIASPDTEVLLRGYCRVDSDVAAAMDKLFLDGRKLSRATLELRRVKDGEALQFEIIRLAAEDWVLVEPVADKS